MSPLAWVGVVHRSGERDQKPFSETVYSLGSVPWSATDLLHASQQHWQIEHGLHWVKDVTFEYVFALLVGNHPASPPFQGGNWNQSPP